MRREAEVASGHKGPEHRANIGDNRPFNHNELEAARRARPADDDVVVFQSTPGYIFTVASKPDRTDPVTGEKIVTRPLLAKFDQDGFYRVRRDDENFDLIYRRLTSDKYFGLGRHFWLLETLRAQAEEAQERALVEQFQANPSLLERVATQLGGRFAQSFEQPKIDLGEKANIEEKVEPKPLDPADPTLKPSTAAAPPPAAAPTSGTKPVAQAPSPAATK